MNTSPENYQNPKPAKRRLAFIVFVLAAIGIVAAWQASQHPGKITLPKVITAEQPGLYEVIRINDGDTLVVSQGGITETVRLIGMDTPEVKDPRKPVQCYGPEASAKTKALLAAAGERVRLVPDPLGDNRDKYQRLLRYVYLPDGTFLNQTLIKEGYAFAYVVFPFSKMDDFVAAETSAEATGAGLWGKCQVDESTKIKQTNQVSS